MKKKVKKLSLDRETLRTLDRKDPLDAIQGAAQDTSGYSCAKVGPSCTCIQEN